MSTTIEQIMIGKIISPQLNGQLSLFDLPHDFNWLRELSALEITQFFTELLEAITQSQTEGEWSLVIDVIEAWHETANIKADPVVGQSIEQGLAELEEDEAVSWLALQAELEG